jgi:dihydroxyacetone kinase-like protein
MYIAYHRIDQILKAYGISVFHAYVGEFATSMEMAGFSISLLKLDDEMKQLLAKPARTPFFEQTQLKM